jgi:D-3-phosphoglycerate dehydrogenase
MPDWKVLITDRLEARGLEILQAQADVVNRAGISPEELLNEVDQYDGLIVRGRTQVTSAVLQQGSRLKVVGRAGVGVDNIDLDAAKDRGVIVVNAPDATTTAVAEHTIALILSLARGVPRGNASLKSGKWLKKELVGVELAGKTLGVIGVGRIGAAVTNRAEALEMIVLGYNPLVTTERIRKTGAEPVSLEELYARSDFISLHVPLNEETCGLIDERALAKMKRGVRLINTARGEVIDEPALLAALESGQVAGAALDVFTDEPPGLSPLVAQPNVIATPHIGGQTEEAQTRAATDIASEVLAALRGQSLRWQII